MPEQQTTDWRHFTRWLFGHAHSWETYKAPLEADEGWIVLRCVECGRIAKKGAVPFGWDYNP